VCVTSYFRHLLPGWMEVIGLVIALAGELSSLSPITYPASFLLPRTRFGGFPWLIAVAVLLPKTQTSEAAEGQS
jgi:hypothetical protein